MNRHCAEIIFCLLLGWPGRSWAREVERPLRLSSATVSSPYDLIRATVAYSPSASYLSVPWFPEELEYDVKWGIFSVGTSNLKVSQMVDFSGEPAYHIVSEAKSNLFCDRFYVVRDLNESWIRASDLSSLGYSKKLREGQFFRDEWVLYDYARKSLLSKRTDKDGSVHYSTATIPGPVQDILSSMYFIRPAKLQVGDQITLDVNTKSNWPLLIKVLKRETITVPAGRFKTVVVEPFLRQEGIFIQKGKSLQVWLSDDDRHVPVFLRAEIFFGYISAYLTGIKGK